MASKKILPRKPAKAKKPPRDPKKLYPGELSPETEADIDRRMMAEYHRTYLRAWYADAVHIIGHLCREAEQLVAAADREPGGAIDTMGSNQLDLYSSALGHARVALSEMMPPTTRTSVVLSNVVDALDRLRREQPWKGRDA
ncbi:MAG TPA: hypothetical protein VD866_27200 [Urbifossiella sp.]|nr:hypothetical protein [Urbifossiella sp.]